ncbi:hypothetical protein FRACYDRAFT_252979 [Fragilariopsis cylindrus CCMP1102]|uniref:F-box domain-containing protein n=1 Tax=Fragilariopsis cylindrus CCMP1102 TaxID=635003 RepID=A0A1E7ELJ5_9STRA|nr:hypothetical protein FRACYDRAFT_252979 [Fragilariopsis cylindrus CCMP1102]|eukprot:OEU06799.1 hypothetical protein FRACYDRAFT_252979 [Fragilariopsis cylindrus CCMP1102]
MVRNDKRKRGTKINNIEQGVVQVVSVELTLMSLPVHLRVSILNLLGKQTQDDDLINLTLVSKQMHEDCKRPGIEWKIIPTIVISSSQQGIEIGDSRTRTLIQNLAHNQTNKKLDHYSHMRIDDIGKFDYILVDEMETITKDVRLEGIVSLDLSLPYPSSGRYVSDHLSSVLSRVLPKLLEVDLSNDANTTLRDYCLNCHLLEKITCHDTTKDFKFGLGGWQMRRSDHLKEIYMDNLFFYYAPKQMIPNFSDLNNPTLNAYFIFHYCCCKMLERVSIRNAKLWEGGDDLDEEHSIIPQNALIKFVRNVPSLRWFRSDLTQENMNMLRLERPDIELLN